MAKSPDAFRTISEVADWLGVQAHVLRFWESKFTQVKPVKRAGGRRYYRPADMQLLSGIRILLHDEGMTIKGVQKILREQGIAEVASLSRPLDEDTDAIEYESATVLPFAAGKPADTEPADEPSPEASGSDAAPSEPAPVARETPAADALDAPVPPVAEPETPDAMTPRVSKSDMPYRPGPLERLARLDRLSPRQMRDLAPVAQELRAWAERVSRAGPG